MKKLFSLLLITLLIFSLIGCKQVISKDQSNIKGDEKISTKEILTIADYYPFKENTIMDYEGIGNEYAEQKTFIEFVEGNRAQMKIMNPGTVFVKVMEYKDGALTEVFAEGEFYHIENMLNANTNSSNTILKEPLQVGNTWSNDEGSTMEITSLDRKIETPSGTYNALEVTTEFKDGRNQKEYYAKDIGLVARIYNDGEYEVKTLLEEIENSKHEMEILSYYPTSEDIGTAYIEQDMEFGTNDSIEEILANIMKNPPSSKLISPISKNTNINKIHLNRESWTLEVDFSKELLIDMNAGSSLELEILKSIVNTLGKFYDVEKVYITIEGSPYESGHIGIKPGESFSVDDVDVKEFNK
ncbi:GerMN domain-containing protein [Tissierella carlieri]|jgi:hypothetical protein|uniref:GerMN domain-containing protein n=1 Tax=Tissierella carlieri TaxID=689904 RepID=UPI001C11C11C|nr:GerMN domain-containing protein [Tissierella carlieri]MBU5312561.1 GerMN domain-containing protein [Tissierella carlieri]